MSDKPCRFPCTQCGECCKRVHLLPETAHLDRGDGSCRHFDDEHKYCQIYSQRPDVCRIDKQYELHYRSLMIWEAFVDLNQRACKLLQLGP